jgi:tripartite-type tricarboxylate transporter receptor subunit TctC
MQRLGIFVLLCLLNLGLCNSSAVSQSSEIPIGEFYMGKQINLYIGFAPGGGYDTYGRLIARFMSEYASVTYFT